MGSKKFITIMFVYQDLDLYLNTILLRIFPSIPLKMKNFRYLLCPNSFSKVEPSYNMVHKFPIRCYILECNIVGLANLQIYLLYLIAGGYEAPKL